MWKQNPVLTDWMSVWPGQTHHWFKTLYFYPCSLKELVAFLKFMLHFPSVFLSFFPSFSLSFFSFCPFIHSIYCIHSFIHSFHLDTWALTMCPKLGEAEEVEQCMGQLSSVSHGAESGSDKLVSKDTLRSSFTGEAPYSWRPSTLGGKLLKAALLLGGTESLGCISVDSIAGWLRLHFPLQCHRQTWPKYSLAPEGMSHPCRRVHSLYIEFSLNPLNSAQFDHKPFTSTSRAA